MRARARFAAACLAIGLGLCAPAGAGAAPTVLADVGRTLGILGGIDEGGFSLGLSALWPIDERLRFGVVGFADDLGAKIGRLRDPNDGSDLGAVELEHRSALGGGWRMDAGLPGRWGWEPYASGTWGAYRVADDHRGDRTRTIGSAGFSLAGGVVRPFGRGSVGAVFRYHRLFNDVAGRYWTAGAEWRWAGTESK